MTDRFACAQLSLTGRAYLSTCTSIFRRHESTQVSTILVNGASFRNELS